MSGWLCAERDGPLDDVVGALQTNTASHPGDWIHEEAERMGTIGIVGA